MSIIKDVNELHISFKTVLIGILLNMPFWYIDLYLFKNDFFSKAVFYIPLVMSFCLTIAWLGFWIMFAAIMSTNENKRNTAQSQIKPELDIIIALFISVLLSCIFTFISYFCHLSFIPLLLISFGFLAFCLVLSIIGNIRVNMKKKN
jgi:hypothetical protein